MKEGAQAAREKRSPLQTVSTVVGILLCVIFIPVIIINVTMIVRSYTDPDHMPSVFGFAPVIVLSGSMSPEFEAGDMILIQKTDPYSLRENDIICYLEEESAVTHRIMEVQYTGGTPVYITKGDANNAEDTTPVRPEQIEGRYTGVHLTGVGDFAIFLQSVPGMVIFIGGPVLLFILWDVLRTALESRKHKGEKSQLQQEHDAMQEELERLRAQVQQSAGEEKAVQPGDTEGPQGQA